MAGTTGTRRIATALLGVLALVMTGAAGAATVTFAYGGSVTSCPDTGIPPCGFILFPGDTVSGPFVVDAADAVPGTSFDYTDVVSFAVMVGEFFAVTSDNSALVAGTVDLGASGRVAGGSLTILATALPDAPPTEVILDFDSNTWLAQALVPGVPDPVFIASGSGGLKPVPLPPAFLVFAPALMAFGLLRRRA